MSWVWVAWIVFFIASFAAFEGYALATGRMTLSRGVWNLSKAWPPFPCVFGIVVGGLAVHFFWIAQACDLATK